MKQILLKTWLVMLCLLVGVGTSWAESFNTTSDDGTIHTAHFYVNGTENILYQSTVAEGSAIIFPNSTPDDINGKKFVGWTENTINGTTNTAPTFVSSGTMGDNDKNYYAVFASGRTTWNQITTLENVTEGTYVIKNDNFVLSSTTTSSASAPVALNAPTVTDGVITGTVTNNMIWTFTLTAQSTTKKFYIKNAEGKNLYEINNNNGLRVNTTADSWTVVEYGENTFYLQGKNNKRFCGKYKSGSDWRSYDTYNAANYANNGYIELYKSDNTYSDYCTTVSVKTTPTLSFEEGTYNVTMGETFTAPTLTNPENVDVTYSATDVTPAGCIEVTEDGTVTINAAGSATITASYDGSGSDKYNSNSASYQLVVTTAPLTTMDDIYAKAQEVNGTETEVRVKFNDWVVSGVNGSNAYVTDGTKGFIIYKSGHNFVAGDILNGTISAKIKLFNGAAEFTTITSTTEGLTVTKGGSVSEQRIAINDLTGINTGSLVAYEDLTYHLNGTSAEFTDGENVIVAYKGIISELPKLVEGKKYDVKGIFLMYGEKKEILPRSAEDIVLKETINNYSVNIETPENGTIVVKDGETVIDNGDEVAEGTILTIECTPTDAENYRFKNWQYKAEGMDAFATRTKDFTYTMPSANVLFKANFEEIPIYTIAFCVNGVERHSEKLKEGTNVTPVDTPEDINGKVFTGWIETASVEGEIPAYVTPSATAKKNVTYYAVFATQKGSGEGTWNKVTDVATLSAGDIVTLVSSVPVDYNSPGTTTKVNGYVAISTQNTNNWVGVGVNVEDNVLTTLDNVQAFTLTATNSNDFPWAFSYSNNYIYAAGGTSYNYLKSTDKLNDLASFSINIEDGAATITANVNGDNPRNSLMLNGNYNSGQATYNPIFTCYLSTSSNTKTSIFKREGGATFSGYTTMPAVLINAQVTSGNEKAFNTTGETAVILNRKFNDDAYNTLVLPFGMSESQIEEVFGSDAKVYNYAGTKTAGENTVTLQFEAATTISANTPVFIYGATNAENKIIEGVTIEDADLPTITDENGAFDYVGVYAISTVAAGDIYINSKNELKTSANGTTKLQPTRAYFKKVGAANVDARAFSINDETTGIAVVEDGNVKLYNGDAYTLSGQKVSANNIKSGIYIIGGRKVVVK